MADVLPDGSAGSASREDGERTRDCSPGHAGKEGPHLEMTGASRGFSRRGERVLAMESW